MLIRLSVLAGSPLSRLSSGTTSAVWIRRRQRRCGTSGRRGQLRGTPVHAGGDPFVRERGLDILPRLVNPPLDGGESGVLRLRDLVVGEASHVAEQEGGLQIEGQPGDRAPD